MLVKDIMTKDNLATIALTAPLQDALKMMNERKVKALIVEKAHENDAYGILTYKNLLQAFVEHHGNIELLNVYDVCTRPAITISAELEIKYAAHMMVNQSIKRVLVTKSNELKGILTMTDIVDTILEKQQEIN
jgi:signal-transduction protein with cAMP-binding, CBS, and nucleotidyltransferase domain